MTKMNSILITTLFFCFTIYNVQSQNCDKCLNGICKAGTNNQCDDCKSGLYDIPFCEKFCYCRDKKPCDTGTGVCLNNECAEGFAGPTCSISCSVDPYKGRFGFDCSKFCHCHASSNCNPFIGRCTPPNCEPGWKTLPTNPLDNCQTPCAADEWGPDCTKKCFCRGGASCDKAIGKCPNDECAAGYKGATCSTPCETIGKGEFGQDCKGICKCKDGNGACNSITGFCIGGCLPGFQSADCQTPCPAGRWGSGCTEQCGQCANTDICNPETGNCPNGCKPGYLEIRCDKECADGKFGDLCLKSCFCKNPPCNKENGVCDVNGCAVGYEQPPTCENACGVGKFGVNCATDCHCKGGVDCNKINGTCPAGCDPGWKSHSCSVPCNGNEYGENCGGECHCQNGATCVSTTGECPKNGKCAPGYRGDDKRCDKKCDVNTCGQDCLTVCNKCSNQACNHIDCTCSGPCFPGFKGANCNTPCDDGKFGLGCVGTCNCLTQNVCEKATGGCPECARGFGGSNCSIRCDQNLNEFGSGCKKICHCEKPDKCPTDTGICPNECKLGYKKLNPHTCSEECENGSFGPYCAGVCHCKSGIACNKATGNCVNGCEDGYSGLNCSIPCPHGYFGHKCIKQCHCKDNKPCETTSGACPLLACEDGWKLISCSVEDTDASSSNDDWKIYGGIAGGILAAILLIIIVGCCVYHIRKKRRASRDKGRLINPKKEALPVNTPRTIPADAISTVSHCYFGPDWDPKYVRDMKEQAKRKNSGPFEPEPEPTEATPRSEPPVIPPRKESESIPTPPPVQPSCLKPNTGNREEDEWAKLEKMRRKPIIDSYFPATKLENRSKNRNLDILPLQEHRVPLGDNPVSDYINAVFVPGQHNSKEMIVTQIPTPVTIASFFRMISQHEVKVCVMLNPASLYVPYWPQDKETISFHPFTVSHIETKQIHGVPIRKMNIKNVETGKDNVVSHIQLPGDQWEQGTSTPGDVKSILHLYQVMENHKAKDQSPVLVHCEDGNERSGFFTTLTHILDKVKEQKQLDVFNIVNSVRANRPQFVTNIEQYKLLYEGAEFYMENMGLRLND
ncbi:DgyrCDS7928 [Dimorphilus gyrociliatus]|uniref:protein-tyrosine-phosphatase n=1 Tax=Dimorphilus gyrociliatus TaxID=2664684 RepID=A0A7I8VSR1_9ANNE|nr:DgyrCDS7928 [Dimorphilus gyrociliatus]